MRSQARSGGQPWRVQSEMTPRRTVLLRHTLPDGTWHFDWMIDRDGEGPLVTFRVQDRLEFEEISAFAAQRIGDHRRVYLDFEGEVSGGRGRVERVAAGVVDRLSEGAEIEVEVRFDGVTRRWRGRCAGGDRWDFAAR